VSTFSGLILLLQTSELLQYAYLNIVIQMVQNIPKMDTNGSKYPENGHCTI